MLRPQIPPLPQILSNLKTRAQRAKPLLRMENDSQIIRNAVPKARNGKARHVSAGEDGKSESRQGRYLVVMFVTTPAHRC